MVGVLLYVTTTDWFGSRCTEKLVADASVVEPFTIDDTVPPVINTSSGVLPAV
jgi:hypothetical protein